MKESTKSLLFIILILSLFPISYLWRKYRDKDIMDHSKYTFGHIFKKTSSLKSGEQWHYRFKYKAINYEGYRSTHIDYDVHIGDYFLVNFSSSKPEHCKILYEYKLDENKFNYIDSIWDTIPLYIFFPLPVNGDTKRGDGEYDLTQ